MRTKFFFFAMFAGVAASAQSTVQIMPISATYTSTPTIQFKVSWTNQTTANHRNKVWVFVDFQSAISPTQKGNWQPATITGTVQKTAGTVSEQSNRGFFLEGMTTNFASTVTVSLSNVTGKFNWCAYATDYPPNAASYSDGTYTFKGTKPFVVNGTTVNSNTYVVTKITSLTDATGCPGGVGRDVPDNGGTCLSGLTAVGGYCRDLAADAASTFTGCNIEIKASDQGTTLSSYSSDNQLCPSGWRWPTQTQAACMCTNRSAVGQINTGYWCLDDYILRGTNASNALYVSMDSCGDVGFPWGTYHTACSSKGQGISLRVRCVR
jgi:hypothetical protein